MTKTLAKHRIIPGKAPGTKWAGIDKEGLSFAAPSFATSRLHLVGVKFEPELIAHHTGNGASLAPLHPETFHEPSDLALARADASKRFDPSHCLPGIGDRSRFERAFQAVDERLQRTGAVVSILDSGGEFFVAILLEIMGDRIGMKIEALSDEAIFSAFAHAS